MATPPSPRPTSAPPGGPTPRGPARGPLQRMDRGRIRRIVAVGSGKGGVGKSSTAVLLAAETRRRGMEVGLLDADITGPSVPRLLGLKGPLTDRGEGIEPAVSRRGIRVVSSQFLVEEEGTPVIWRGPLVTRLVQQFFGGVDWGALDHLFLDLPPGTSDVPLTIFQTIPIDGMVFVSTPQELAQGIVRKAMNMARDVHVPLLGVVENMTEVTCPHCHAVFPPFGPSHVDAIAAQYDIPVLGRLPIDPRISALADGGELEAYESPALRSTADALLRTLDERDAQRPKIL
ncbi:MAG: Mrp/NBP35 family ATP-binding protein [Thermoplasmata archaeon]